MSAVFGCVLGFAEDGERQEERRALPKTLRVRARADAEGAEQMTEDFATVPASVSPSAKSDTGL